MLKFGNLWGILPLAPEPFRFIPFKQNRETEKLKSFFFFVLQRNTLLTNN